jgi:hypothetical protein
MAAPVTVKLNRSNANVNAQLAMLRNAKGVLVELAPLWELPSDLLAQYLERDAAAAYVVSDLLPLMPRVQS